MKINKTIYSIDWPLHMYKYMSNGHHRYIWWLIMKETYIKELAIKRKFLIYLSLVETWFEKKKTIVLFLEKNLVRTHGTSLEP